jgi:taurine dioxygenase
MALEIRKLGDYVGAEALGVDLSKPVDEETRRALNEAVVENVALVIRDQKFGPDDFVQAASVFGEPMRQNFTSFTCKEQPLINFISNTFEDKSGKRVYHSGYWHTDHTNRETPPKYTTLYALELPESGGGDTGVFNTRAAYAALPDDWKKKLDALKTVNVYHGSAARNRSQKYEVAKRLTDDVPIIHNLVRTHSENGQKAIYMHQGKLENFVGMSPEESHDLVEEMLSLAVKPEFVYRHKWRIGDMLIWDNRQSMHQAFKDYDLKETRTLYRIIVQPEAPQ